MTLKEFANFHTMRELKNDFDTKTRKIEMEDWREIDFIRYLAWQGLKKREIIDNIEELWKQFEEARDAGKDLWSFRIVRR